MSNAVNVSISHSNAQKLLDSLFDRVRLRKSRFLACWLLNGRFIGEHLAEYAFWKVQIEGKMMEQ